MLNEVDDSYNLFFMSMENNTAQVMPIKRLDGYDANAILEQFMGTNSVNDRTERMIHSIYEWIEQGDYEKAEEIVRSLVELTSENHPDVLASRMEMKRRRR